MCEPTLPIEAIRTDLITALQQDKARILLKAPTGSGKSTRVPPMLAEQGWTEKGTIVIIQPRRIAARLLAERVAELRRCPIGQEVGYAVRFDSQMGPHTRILYVTDGVFNRMLIDNPRLTGVCAVLFDEFHERRLAGDLSLARCLNLQESTRPDLALIVMSATLEVAGLDDYLAPCTLLETGGRLYPVDILYKPPHALIKTQNHRGAVQHELPLWESVSLAVREAIQSPDHGNILVFLPGSYEIRKTIELLEHDTRLKGFDIEPLYGSLSPQLQRQVLNPGTRPKIIVSTNIAETSISIPGLRTVIDSGLVRMAYRDARRDMDTLTIKKISKASADQRAGRAGRIAPGRCFRLWSEPDHARRSDFEAPEVLRVELSDALLSLSCWGVTDFKNFRWLTPPQAETLQNATNLLTNLGALDENNQLTTIGRTMAQYPLAPRLARLMLAGCEHHCLLECAMTAALIQGERLWTKPQNVPVSFCEKSDYTDFQPEFRALLYAEKSAFNPSTCQSKGILARAAREVLNSYNQLITLCLTPGQKRPTQLPLPDFDQNQTPFTQALLESFPDHVGIRNSIAANTCKLTGQKRGKIPSGSAAYRDIAFIATEIAEIEGKNLETVISRCTMLTADDLRLGRPHEWKEQFIALYDDKRRRVVQHYQQTYRGLVFVDQEKGEPTAEEAAPLLAEKINDGTLTLSQWNHEVDQWIRRLNTLRTAMPELELPSFDDQDKTVAFSILCEGALGYKEIKDRPILPILKEWLSPWQRQALDQYAPTQISLPNGQNPKVTYDELGIPRIALTVQRLYDVAETPRIANNQLPVTVEILAPNQRPWQITQNLASFWENGYPQMKKDLAARYPKHLWR